MDNEDVPAPMTETGSRQTLTVDEREPRKADDQKRKDVIRMEKPPVHEDSAQGEKKVQDPARDENQIDGITKEQAVPPESEPEVKEDKPALDYFKAGDFLKASEIWKRELSGARITHSILLELDCMKESVLNAYNRIDNKRNFFILKRELNGRTCFLVFWGRFKSTEKASEALSLVDAYFWSQSHPPRVVNIQNYF
jgi:hypothetical protein